MSGSRSSVRYYWMKRARTNLGVTMAPETIDEILEKIDKAVGPPENETPEQRQKRREMIVRDAEARKVRKLAGLRS